MVTMAIGNRQRLGSDGQIAAVAFVNGLTLVTDKVVEFRNFERLRVENWCVR